MVGQKHMAALYYMCGGNYIMLCGIRDCVQKEKVCRLIFDKNMI
jgi:hypothetical protein